jgi:hypothetical protein
MPDILKTQKIDEPLVKIISGLLYVEIKIFKDVGLSLKAVLSKTAPTLLDFCSLNPQEQANHGNVLVHFKNIIEQPKIFP